MKCFTESFVIFILCINHRIACLTIRQKQHRIISRCIAINRNHIVSILDIFAECFLKQCFGNVGICCNKTKHGTHIRMNHSRAFAHAAHGHFLTANLKRHSDFLRNSICGHNGFCCQMTGVDTAVKSRCQHINPCFNSVHFQLHTDNTCGCHQYSIFLNTKDFRSLRCCCFAVSHSLHTCTGIGNTTVANDCLRMFGFIYNLSIPFHRSSLYNVGCKSACSHTWYITVDHGHINKESRHDRAYKVLEEVGVYQIALGLRRI